MGRVTVHEHPSRSAARQRWTAVLFDFDGTLWDPEPLIYQAHAELFADAGAELTLAAWTEAVGQIDVDIWRHLGRATGRSVDPAALDVRLDRRLADLLGTVGARPGISELLQTVDSSGLRRAIVSNSRRDWVDRYSAQCGIAEGWRGVHCADGNPHRAKPSPALYLAALENLAIPPEQALVFEDSPTGVRAAKAAGITCVAVTNPVTETLDLGGADLRFDSFEDVDLSQVLEKLA